MEKITYEVLGYASEDDFENRNFEELDQFIEDKEEAMELGNDSLEFFEVVKVQSNDREEIYILRRP